MARRYLSVLLLLLCAACATPHDLVKVPGVQPEQACDLLEEAGYDPGGCWSIMDTGQMRQAVIQFQEHQRLKPIDGNLNGDTWLRLNTVVRAMRKQRVAQAKPREATRGNMNVSVRAGGKPEAASVKPRITEKAQAAPTAGNKSVKDEALAKKLMAKPLVLPPPLGQGDRVYVVERAKCLPRSGAWLLVYVGVVQSLEGDKVMVALRDRISYRYNPGEKGVDSKDWFCVPRRRHCYSSVPFGDWGGTHRPGQSVAFDKAKTRRASQNPKDTLYDLARVFCR